MACLRESCPSATAKSLQSCPTLCDPRDGSPPDSPIPGILQARTTGVGCHFLLQCMKGKSESEVSQACLTLRDPMDCSPPGSSIHGIYCKLKCLCLEPCPPVDCRMEEINTSPA